MAVAFTSPELEAEFHNQLHPDTRSVCVELDNWLDTQGMAPLTLTSIARTDAQEEAIYFPIGKALVAKFNAKEPMSDNDKQTARLLLKMNDVQMRAWAAAKFSWHKVLTAVDIRIRHYTAEQQALLMNWLQKRCTKGPWELVTENHGTGPHYHVARRDFVWRANFSKQKVHQDDNEETTS